MNLEILQKKLSKKLVNNYSQFILSKENGEYDIDKTILDNFEENEILKQEVLDGYSCSYNVDSTTGNYIVK